MLNIRPITPFELESWDPYAKGRSKVEKLISAKETRELSNRHIDLSSSEMFDAYTRLLSKISWPRHAAPYLQYNEELFSKYAPQGGSASWESLRNILSDYYAYVEDRPLPKTLYRGRDILLHKISYLIERVGYPTIPAERGVDNTFAGLPTGCKKGTYKAETEGMAPYRHVYPAVPGVRIMRNSVRAIFMDSCANVRYIEKELTAVRNWLKTNLPEYFGAWLNPNLVVNPSITRGLQRNWDSVETDYIKMDQRFRFQIVAELILPIYELLIPGAYLSFASCIEELFSQPLFMGAELWTGEHGLFSGQGPTNDFETLYTIMLQLGSIFEVAPSSEQYQAALGDDSLVLIERQYSRPLMDRMIDVSNAAGLKIHEIGDKSRIGRGEARFCRRVYALPLTSYSDTPILAGWYPSILALNSIVNPEYPHHDRGVAIAADLSRMDNLFHNRVEYTYMIDMISSHYKADLLCPADTLPRDWWERLYGTRWSPQTSKTFTYLQNKYVDRRAPLELHTAEFYSSRIIDLSRIS